MIMVVFIMVEVSSSSISMTMTKEGKKSPKKGGAAELALFHERVEEP